MKCHYIIIGLLGVSLGLFSCKKPALVPYAQVGIEDRLSMRCCTWNEDGSIYKASDYLVLKSNACYDMDSGLEEKEEMKMLSDLRWVDEGLSSRWLEPSNGASIVIYHLY